MIDRLLGRVAVAGDCPAAVDGWAASVGVERVASDPDITITSAAG
jgi:hypothetical protein